MPLNLNALFIAVSVSAILLAVYTLHGAADKETLDIIFVNQTLDIGQTKPLQTTATCRGKYYVYTRSRTHPKYRNKMWEDLLIHFLQFFK